MKERQILFSGAMVRAVRDGRKTQTRRVVKPQFEREPVAVIDGVPSWDAPTNYDGEVQMNTTHGKPCPYGVPGDRLSVRETFFAYGRWETRYSAKKGRDEWHFVDMTIECDRAYQYAADDQAVPLETDRSGVLPGWWKRPAIFMPHSASRITLANLDVRVERLQDISEDDAIAEGVEPIDFERYEHDRSICPRCGGTRLHDALGPNGGVLCDVDCRECDTHVKRYRHLWDSLNAARGYGWDTNPWVWCVEFKRIEQ